MRRDQSDVFAEKEGEVSSLIIKKLNKMTKILNF